MRNHLQRNEKVYCFCNKCGTFEVQARYYLHGDEHEKDASKIFCSMCDSFVAEAHFFDPLEHSYESSGSHVERIRRQITREYTQGALWLRGKGTGGTRWCLKWTRLVDAPNLVLRHAGPPKRGRKSEAEKICHLTYK